MMMPGGQVIALLRQHRELGQLGQRDIHPEGRAFALPAVHPARDIGVDRALRHQPVEQQLGIDARRRRSARAKPCRRRPRRPRGRWSTITSSTGVLSTMSTPASRQARAIAWVIEPMPPIAWPQAPGHARRLAEQMVEQDVGGARRLRRGEIADHAVEAEQRLGQVALEMAVEDVGRAAHREIVDDPRFGQRQAGHVAAEAQQLRDRADPRADVRAAPAAAIS